MERLSLVIGATGLKPVSSHSMEYLLCGGKGAVLEEELMVPTTRQCL